MVELAAIVGICRYQEKTDCTVIRGSKEFQGYEKDCADTNWLLAGMYMSFLLFDLSAVS